MKKGMKNCSARNESVEDVVAAMNSHADMLSKISADWDDDASAIESCAAAELRRFAGRIMAAYMSEKSSCDKVFSELEDALLEIQDRIADITADMKGEAD